MSILNSISRLAHNYREYAERANALKELQKLSVRQLADIGVEPYQLSAGVSAYPWKDEVIQAEKITPVREVAKPANNFANTMITLYSAWGRPVRHW